MCRNISPHERRRQDWPHNSLVLETRWTEHKWKQFVFYNRISIIMIIIIFMQVCFHGQDVSRHWLEKYFNVFWSCLKKQMSWSGLEKQISRSPNWKTNVSIVSSQKTSKTNVSTSSQKTNVSVLSQKQMSRSRLIWHHQIDKPMSYIMINLKPIRGHPYITFAPKGEGEVRQNRHFAYGCVWWGGEGVQTDAYVRITIDACILNCCLFIGTVAVIGLLQEII